MGNRLNMLCMCTQSSVRTYEAKIICSRDAQCYILRTHLKHGVNLFSRLMPTNKILTQYGLSSCKGGFPLSCNFYVRTDVNLTGFTCVNKIETMYEKPRVNVRVEPRSTFTFTSNLPYIVSNLFTHVKPVKVYVRTHVKITQQWKSTLSDHLP